MEGSRLLILQILQKDRDSTVVGLARAIGLASATVRRHLDILQRDGLVAFTTVHKRTGRPEHSFHLTEEGQETLPKGYKRLLGLMIGELALLTAEDTKAHVGDQLLEFVFKRVSEQACGEIAVELEGENLEHRLQALLQLLHKENFSPEAEVVDGTLNIRLLNCPFRSVALRTRAVCSFDSNLISTVLGVDVERSECIQNGHDSCMYTANVR